MKIIEELKGTVQRITFQSEDADYTVFRFLLEGSSSLITCVTSLPGVKNGSKLHLKGEWQLHTSYGKQFVVSDLELMLPNDTQAMISYIGSGLFKGIRKKRATAIVERFGLQTLAVIAEEPDRLIEAGINLKMAREMHQTLLANRQSERLTMYLQSLGLTPKQALRIFRHYKDRYTGDLVAFIEANPYKLAEDVLGIGFRTADELALRLNIPADSPFRLRIALNHILSSAANDGHCYLPQSVLQARAAKELDLPEVDFIPFIREQVKQGELIAEVNATDEEELDIYLPAFCYAEIGVTNRCLQIVNRPLMTSLVSEDLDIESLEHQMGIKLALEQKDALNLAQHNSFLIITGGPGTGKTTLLRALLATYRRQGLSYSLAAPTGRAARRLSDVTGSPALTVHRLLEYLPSGEGMVFQRDEVNPLTTDVVIVDEASMLDLILMHNLLKAISPEGRLILVGDKDQLPSVGPGQVLSDLIASQAIPTVRLTTIFRQAEQSQIVTNAHRINQGFLPLAGTRDSDFFFIEEAAPDKVLKTIVDLCARRLPEFTKLDPIEDIQVLCPMRRGVVGVESLNQELQNVLNKQPSNFELHSLGDRFRQGDKVMQLKNNYDKGVFNGDIGRVVTIDLEQETLEVAYPDGAHSLLVSYRQQEMDEICLAYAISVHKAQGSEYPIVIMPLVPEHRWLLQRNLLYTAVTRAKKLMVIVGSKPMLAQAIAKIDSTKRYTKLVSRLQANLLRSGN